MRCWRHCFWQALRLLGQIIQRNLKKLRQLIKLAITAKPFAYSNSLLIGAMPWHKTIWACCMPKDWA